MASIKLYLNTLKSGRKSYYLRYRFDNEPKPKDVTLDLYLVVEEGTPTQKKAIRLKNEETTLLANNIFAQKKKEFESNNGTLKEVTDFFEYFDKIARIKTNYYTYNSYKNTKKHFIDFLGKDRLLSTDITKQLIEKFAEYLKTQISDITTLLYVSKITFVLDEMYRDELIDTKITDKLRIKYKIEEKPKNFLTEQELTILYQSSCKYAQVKELVFMSVLTGLRLVDLVGDKMTNTQGITPQQVREVIYKKQVKTKEYIAIPIHEDLKQFLNTLLEGKKETDSIFTFSRPYYTINTKKWLKECGITKKLKFHDNRRTYGMRLKNNGASLDVVMGGMGHTNPETTKVYVGEKFLESKIKDAVLNLPSLQSTKKTSATYKITFKRDMQIQGKNFESGTSFVYGEQGYYKNGVWVELHSYHFELFGIAEQLKNGENGNFIVESISQI